jgi:hypothetical protein
MPTNVYCAFFHGQFGEVFSSGVDVLAAAARAQGVVADVFDYQDWATAAQRVDHWRGLGDKIALFGYSLGCSSATYIQSVRPVDLLMCCAESELAENYSVNKENTKRSILWMGQDFLSDANSEGFDVVVPVQLTPFTFPILDHLAMDWSSVVTKGAIEELIALPSQQ